MDDSRKGGDRGKTSVVRVQSLSLRALSVSYLDISPSKLEGENRIAFHARRSCTDLGEGRIDRRYTRGRFRVLSGTSEIRGVG